ncbi:MAG TPA: carboxylesterase family protein [Methanocorpusculum sp.]|nr:carboxylesterase family protein [Methanocorpusculum sp.]
MNTHPSDITEITVSRRPDKMVYFTGEALDTAGMRIDAVTSSGVSFDVTPECVITPVSHIFTEGDSEITIKAAYTAGGKVFSAAVTVYKFNTYHENSVISREYDRGASAVCSNGIFVGKREGDVLMFRGIPFVKEQPSGKNRFKAPVGYDYSADPDTTVYEAYYFGKEALQEVRATYPTSEECLYLNVYTNVNGIRGVPSKSTDSDDTDNTADSAGSADSGKEVSANGAEKPVMVWIHGGSYVFGGTADPLYNLYNLAAENPDVVFVSVPYRLSILGFADLSSLEGCSKEYEAALNLGLLDITEALHWVYENIHAFGGDKKNITLFGQSAGGGCASLLALYDKARPYIAKIISQSGPPAFSRSKELAAAVADKIFAELDVSSVDELMKVDPAALVALSPKYGDLCTFPTRDGEIIPEDPYDAYSCGAAKEIPILLGCNANESGYWFKGVKNHQPEPVIAYFAEKAEVWTSMLTTAEKEKLASCKADIKKKIEAASMKNGEEDAKEDAVSAVSEFVNQLMFVAPVVRFAEAHAEGGGDVYQYFLTAESKRPYMKSAHGIELSSVFGNEGGYLGPAADSVFSRTIQKMWIQFAKTGNPSLPAEDSPTGSAVFWPKFSLDTKPVMQMDEDRFHVEYHLSDKIVDRERIYPLVKYYGAKPAGF